MAALSGVFPMFYDTTDQVRGLASTFIIILGIFTPVQAFINAAYFTLRSGGQTYITLIFDSVFMWVISVPTALLLVKFTNFDITLIYFICQAVDIIKVVIGLVLLKKGVWIRNIVSEKK